MGTAGCWRSTSCAALDELRQEALAMARCATHLSAQPGAREAIQAHLGPVSSVLWRMQSVFAAKTTPFADRTDAGQKLGQRLRRLNLARPIVYALPRGGVPIGAEVAAALRAPLDLMLVRKIGAPFQPELAVGAVVDGSEAGMVLNPDVVALTGTSEAYIATARSRALEEIERRRQRYLAGRPRPDPHGHAAVVVDDGLATGATARAALHALRRRAPAQLVLAVPVASPDILTALQAEADTVVCLRAEDLFHGVGGFYVDFHQLTDEEVIRLLDAAAARHAREQDGGTDA